MSSRTLSYDVSHWSETQRNFTPINGKLFERVKPYLLFQPAWGCFFVAFVNLDTIKFSSGCSGRLPELYTRGLTVYPSCCLLQGQRKTRQLLGNILITS